MSSLEKIKDLTWAEVFEAWRQTEEPLEHWQKFWPARGFTSWQAWREKTHANLRGAELNWALYKIINPLTEVPEWHGGMFHGWAKWYYPVLPEQPPRLKDLLSHPGVHNHWFVREIARNFPKVTTIMAIKNPAGEIMIVEGMHRCCALTLAARDWLPVQTELTVALADWPNDNWPKLGLGWEE